MDERKDINARWLWHALLCLACAGLAQAHTPVLPDVVVSAPASNRIEACWAQLTAPVQVSITPAADHICGAVDWCLTADGDIMFVWEEALANGSDWDVYAQRFSRGGLQRWPANLLVNGFRGNQRYPRVAAADDGGAYIVWQSDSASRDNVNIWCQRILRDGRWAWTETPTPVCTASRNQVRPVIAGDSDGSAIITWVDYRNGNADVYAQRMHADGAPFVSDDGVAVVTAAGDQNNVRFEYDTNGYATAIVWDDNRPELRQPIQVKTDLSQLPIPEPGCALFLMALAAAASRFRQARSPRR